MHSFLLPPSLSPSLPPSLPPSLHLSHALSHSLDIFMRTGDHCDFLQKQISDLTPERHTTLLRNCTSCTEGVLAKKIDKLNLESAEFVETGTDEEREEAAAVRYESQE